MKNKYTPKRQKEIIGLFAPSILGMIISIVCLIGTSWAWFTASVTTQSMNITAADYKIEVEIKDGETTVEPNDGVYELSQKENGYIVTIIAKRTESAASTGYCLINGMIPTKQLAPDESLTFTLYPDVDTESGTKNYSFVAVWGNYSGDNTIVKDKDIVIRDEVVSSNMLMLENTNPENTEDAESNTTTSSNESQELEDDDETDNKLPANPDTTSNPPTVPENTLEEDNNQSMFSDENVEFDVEPDVEAATESTATE